MIGLNLKIFNWIDLPPWFLKAADKIRRGFLWAGADCAKGGQCLVGRVHTGSVWRAWVAQPQVPQRRAANQMAMAGKNF